MLNTSGQKILKKPFIVFGILVLLIDLAYFSASYFFNFFHKVFDWPMMIIPYVIPSIFLFVTASKNSFKKISLIVGSIILGIFSGIVILFIPMFIPGSKEHNYVMYSVCIPAIDKYYQERRIPETSKNEVGKDGWSKWWYQHKECEENVWDGKGPVFSDNPPDFIPK